MHMFRGLLTSWIASIQNDKTLGLANPDSVNAVAGAGTVIFRLAFDGKNMVAQFGHRIGHILQRLAAGKPDFGSLAGLHLFDQQTRSYERHETDVVGDVQEMINYFVHFNTRMLFRLLYGRS